MIISTVDICSEYVRMLYSITHISALNQYEIWLMCFYAHVFVCKISAVKENKHRLSVNQTADYFPIFPQAAFLFIYWRRRLLNIYLIEIDSWFEINQINCGFVAQKNCYRLINVINFVHLLMLIHLHKTRAASIFQHKIK